MRIIGLCGRARSGKSTTALSMKQEATSKGLKAEVFEMSSYVLADLNADYYNSWHGTSTCSPAPYNRESIDPKLLVERGMARRKQNPYYWINILNQDIEEKNPDVAVIPNIRFWNEAKNIKDVYNGTLVRVKSYVKDGVEFISTDRDPNHESEIQQLSIEADYILANMRGKEELLRYQAKTLLNYLLDK